MKTGFRLDESRLLMLQIEAQNRLLIRGQIKGGVFMKRMVFIGLVLCSCVSLAVCTAANSYVDFWVRAV